MGTKTDLSDTWYHINLYLFARPINSTSDSITPLFFSVCEYVDAHITTYKLWNAFNKQKHSDTSTIFIWRLTTGFFLLPADHLFTIAGI